MAAQNPELLKAIAAAPDDDFPRGVYADWLDENEQPARAEFIRVQCELEKQPRVDRSGRKKELQQRENALLEEFGAQWRQEDAQINAQGQPDESRRYPADYLDQMKFVRGFLPVMGVPDRIYNPLNSITNRYPIGQQPVAEALYYRLVRDRQLEAGDIQLIKNLGADYKRDFVDPRRGETSTPITYLLANIPVDDVRKNLAILQALVENGADPNRCHYSYEDEIRNQTNNLYYIHQVGLDVPKEQEAEYMKFLVRHGAKHREKNNDGEDIHDLISSTRDVELKAVMQKAVDEGLALRRADQKNKKSTQSRGG